MVLGGVDQLPCLKADNTHCLSFEVVNLFCSCKPLGEVEAFLFVPELHFVFLSGYPYLNTRGGHYLLLHCSWVWWHFKLLGLGEDPVSLSSSLMLCSLLMAVAVQVLQVSLPPAGREPSQLTSWRDPTVLEGCVHHLELNACQSLKP